VLAGFYWAGPGRVLGQTVIIVCLR